MNAGKIEGNFAKYDVAPGKKAKADGTISLPEYNSKRAEFLGDFLKATITEKLYVLSKCDEKTRSALLNDLTAKKENYETADEFSAVIEAIDVLAGKYVTCGWMAKYVSAAIEYALKNKNADAIGPNDFDHGHILVLEHETKSRDPNLLLRSLKDRSFIILYHTQENTGKFHSPKDYYKRNLLQEVPDGSIKPISRPVGQSAAKFLPSVYPKDLGRHSVGFIIFELDPKGKESFKDPRGKSVKYNLYFGADYKLE